MKFLHSLQWRIVLAYAALIFISMGVVSLYLVDFVRDTYIADLQGRLEQEAGLVAETASRYFRGPLEPVDLQLASERMAALAGARVTVIARDGTVLADTEEDPAAMENHIGRPEVQDALDLGLGRSIRVSATVHRELLYTAVPVQVDGTLMGVARLAVPTSQVRANVSRIRATIALSAIVVALLSIALGYLLARRTSRSVRAVTEAAQRLARGDLEHRVESLASDETQRLAEAFNGMAAALRDMIRDLSGERNKLAAILDTMADGVVLVRPDGQIELVNEAAGGLLGLSVQQARGRRFMELVRDHDLQRLISGAMESQQQLHGEIELLRFRRFLSVIATPLGTGEPGGVLLTVHDLTRFRQVETTRREFVSNVSHELRNPLASLTAMVETLEDGALQDQSVAQDFVQRIHGEVDRMSHLVSDLLELSRLESGQVALDARPFDMAALAREVTEVFQRQAQARGVALEALAPGEPLHANGEKERLRQVLVNLLDNALKFTPPGGRVSVSAMAVGHDIRVSVTDTGTGIPAEHLPHIFERFYRVERSRRDGGTGLGLAIVKHIVLAHGGEVSVESQEGVGSTFSFTLPRAA